MLGFGLMPKIAREPPMNDVRARAKAFYNALDFDRPINFGQAELVRAYRAQPASLYVECCPDAGQWPQVSKPGIDKLVAIVARRFSAHGAFFSDAQLRRLAQSSGGDLRDFFRMARLAITHAASAGIPLTDAIIEHAEDAVRRDMLPIAADDREWLVRIAKSHTPELPSLDELPKFARLQEGKYVLQYRNGEDWYAVHPLLREELGLG